MLSQHELEDILRRGANYREENSRLILTYYCLSVICIISIVLCCIFVFFGGEITAVFTNNKQQPKHAISGQLTQPACSTENRIPPVKVKTDEAHESRSLPSDPPAGVAVSLHNVSKLVAKKSAAPQTSEPSLFGMQLMAAHAKPEAALLLPPSSQQPALPVPRPSEIPAENPAVTPLEKDKKKPPPQAVAKTVRITQSIDITRPARDVWMRIGSFGDMGWHPDVTRNRGGVSNRQGTVRVLTIRDLGSFAETLSVYSDAGMFYAYQAAGSRLKSLALPGYSARLSVKPLAPDLSRVTWEAQIEPALNGSKASRITASKLISEIFGTGLTSLKRHMEASQEWTAIPEGPTAPSR